jgi:uncharacterized repeat protein (TIGR01451 family)
VLKLIRNASLLAFAGFAVHAWAQGPTAAAEGVDVKLVGQKVVVNAGKEALVEATEARPGDTIEYRATYSNKGKDLARKLEATLPVPADMQLIGSTVRPTGALASIDNRKFEPMPLKRKVKLADGREELRDVPLSEYRALRWQLGDLAAGASQVVSARMQVNPVESRSAPAAAAAPAAKPAPAAKAAPATPAAPNSAPATVYR